MPLAEDLFGLGRVVVERDVGQLGLDGQGHKILLGAVMEVAFQPPRLVLGGDQPLPGGPRVLDQPGVRQHQADHISECAAW